MKAIRFLWAVVVVYLAIVPPAQFLKGYFMDAPVFSYEKDREWKYDHGEIGMYPRCAYILFGKQLTYCLDKSKDQSTDDLDSVALDIPINVPKTFISELLRVPNSPLEQEVCFEADTFFKDFPNKTINAETRFFLYKKPIKMLEEMEEKNMEIITVDHSKCIRAMSGMTLIGIGQGMITLFDESFSEVVEAAARLRLPVTPGPVVITHSGAKTFIGNTEVTEVQRKIIEKTDKHILYEVEGTIPLDYFEFSIVNKLRVYSRLSHEQKIILFIAVFSVWLLAMKTLIDAGKYLYAEIRFNFIEGMKGIRVWLVRAWKISARLLRWIRGRFLILFQHTRVFINRLLRK